MYDDTSEPPHTSDEDVGELRFSRTQSYFDRSMVIRLLIGLFFAASLFLFLHFRETYVETVELGSPSKKFVIAQINFSFPDEEATTLLKQEVAQMIRTIYQLEDDQVHARVAALQKHITQDPKGREIWEALKKQTDFEDVPLVLSLVADGLSQARFTKARTIRSIHSLPSDELPIPAKYFFLFHPPPVGEQVQLSLQFWAHFEELVFASENIPRPIAHFLIGYLTPSSWLFEVDQGLEYSLRKLAQKQIPKKYTFVRSGERIVDQGEFVTARHLAMLQAMKEGLDQKRQLFTPFAILGTLLMTGLLIVVATVYLWVNHRDIIFSNRKLSLLVSILLLSLLAAKGGEMIVLKNASNMFDLVRFPLFIPFAAILVSSLINVRVGAFTIIFLALVFTMTLAVEVTPFLVVNVLTALVAIFMTRNIRRRKEVFVVCGKAWLCSLFVILAFNLYEDNALSFSLIGDLTSTFLFMLLTAILIVGLLPMLESLFRIMTDITLMEFLDPSNELLRRLSIEAPGTYQHSMVVGNLAEAASTAIGANGLFCRVATQYHDVGKLANPQYFTENQLGGVDLHQLLTPTESAQVIIAHVSEGVVLARKVGLPEQFIDIIKEHHGTTLAYYFYHKEIERQGSDKGKVDQCQFRYSGPKPRSKESTIIMIADTLEAASRCLSLFNEESVSNLVETLIAQKMEDGQFEDSLLTFEELSLVKRVFINTLLAASHPRVQYPPHHPGEEG